MFRLKDFLGSLPSSAHRPGVYLGLPRVVSEILPLTSAIERGVFFSAGRD